MRILKGQFHIETAINVTALISGLLMGLFGILLTMMGDIKAWSQANVNWLLPFTFIFCLFLVFTIGWMFSRLHKSNQNANGMRLNKMWDEEKKARTVWVVSPELYFDTHSADCIAAVKRNLLNQVDYRYIIQDTQVTRDRRGIYQNIYRLTDKEMKATFLALPASELTQFQTEIVIYNAEKSTKSAYGYPHHSPMTSPDIVEFPSEIVNYYESKFREVWQTHQ